MDCVFICFCRHKMGAKCGNEFAYNTLRVLDLCYRRKKKPLVFYPSEKGGYYLKNNFPVFKFVYVK
jgi:hypothetical protein